MPRGGWIVPLVVVLACRGEAQGPAAGTPVASAPLPDSTVAALVERISEPGGYFDTDNLISNERSYLHAVSDLRAAGIEGGAYLGVGPDQNFSYMAQIEPELAIIVDIRPDNVLQHLIYKALFHASRNRLEYLALLTGRPVPDDAVAWSGASLEDLLARWRELEPSEASMAAARARVAEAIEGFG